MGHYCGECGEKLVGGVVARTCGCAECFCSKCWKNLFNGEYTNAMRTYYYYNNAGELVKENEKLYVMDKSTIGRCKECKKLYGGIRNYNPY